MRKILITGLNSYIGNFLKNYLSNWPSMYQIDIKDTIDWEPKKNDFLGYDVVFNVAGIAHKKETNENKHLYYEINRDLSVNIAKMAKEGGVKQYILLSSMAVYGKETGVIKKNSPLNPKNAYGKSKAEADIYIEKLVDENFKFTCLRPPMVYGKGCKGNYQLLRNFAVKSPIFPKYQNKRSMIYVGNLCEFVKSCIDYEKTGVFFPQNENYINTSEMVYLIAQNHRKKIFQIKCFNFLIRILHISLIKKVFGDLIYEKIDTVNKFSFEESIRLTEE